MSTKTLRKRIALVAVSAMGFGLLSTVAAYAGAGAMTVATTAAAGTYGKVGSAVTTANAQTISITTAGKVTFTFDGSASGAHVNLSGTCKVSSVSGTGPTVNSGATSVTADGTNNPTVEVSPTAAGTCVVKAYAAASESSTADKLTITVLATTTVGAFSADKSYGQVVSTAASGAVSSNADTAGAYKVINGGEGILAFSINDGNGTAMPTTTTVTASATNGALVSFTAGAEVGPSVSKSYGGTYENVYVAQGASNTAYDTVVTISVDGVTWVTRAFQLQGDVTAINLSGPTVGSLSGSDGVYYMSATDTLGHLIASKTPSVGSTVLNSSVTAVSTSNASSASDVVSNTFTCSTISGSTKLKVTFTNAALVKVTSNEITLKCGGNPYTWTAKLDKSTYKPGEIATLTIAALDSKGNAVNAAATLGTASTYPVAISGAQLTPIQTPTNSDTFSTTDGAKTYKFSVGTTEGSYNLVVDLPKWEGGANSSSSSQAAAAIAYTVASGSTSVTNAEVLAAIVKLIASINKQIAALQKALTKK